MDIVEHFKVKFPSYKYKCFDIKVKLSATHRGVFIDYMEKESIRVTFPRKREVINHLHVAAETKVEHINVFVKGHSSCEVKDLNVYCTNGDHKFEFFRSRLTLIMEEFYQMEEFYSIRMRRHIMQVIDRDQMACPLSWKKE